VYHALTNEVYSLINPKYYNVGIVFVGLELLNFSAKYICMRMHLKCYFGKHFKSIESTSTRAAVFFISSLMVRLPFTNK
jgi:hypothetical protein